MDAGTKRRSSLSISKKSFDLGGGPGCGPPGGGGGGGAGGGAGGGGGGGGAGGGAGGGGGGGDGGGGGAGGPAKANLASMLVSPPRTRSQTSPSALHGPPQPVKTLPGPTCAVSRTGEGTSNAAVHCGGQSIPDGLLVTRPGPLTVTRRFAESAADALTLRGRAVQPRTKRTAQAIAWRGRRRSAAEM
jgi:hypothetical protein